MNDTLSLRSGNLVITPTNFFSKARTNVPIKVRKQPLDGVAARYQEIWASVRKKTNRLSSRSR